MLMPFYPVPCVYVKPLPNDAGLATAILHSLDPAKDFLGVGLADGDREHGSIIKWL